MATDLPRVHARPPGPFVAGAVGVGTSTKFSQVGVQLGTAGGAYARDPGAAVGANRSQSLFVVERGARPLAIPLPVGAKGNAREPSPPCAGVEEGVRSMISALVGTEGGYDHRSLSSGVHDRGKARRRSLPRSGERTEARMTISTRLELEGEGTTADRSSRKARTPVPPSDRVEGEARLPNHALSCIRGSWRENRVRFGGGAAGWARPPNPAPVGAEGGSTTAESEGAETGGTSACPFSSWGPRGARTTADASSGLG